MNIDGASILVTGGCGLIGATTVDQLLQRHAPARIIILDNLTRGTRRNIEHSLRDNRVVLIEGDIRNSEVVTAALKGVDLVFHFAAIRITACAEDPVEAMSVMCDGSFNVVECARRTGVRKIVAASSASIYGMAERFPTSEDHHPYGNRTWYGASKVMLEGLLRSYHDMYGMNYVALRYFNVYGPRMDIHGKYTEVLIRWMERIEQGEPPLILGDGLQTMDFIYVDDIARANLHAMLGDATDEVFNVACGVETSLRELADRLCTVMGKPGLEPVYGPERSVNPVPRRLADTTKAANMLDFRAEVDLDEGLRRLVEWWRSEKGRTH